MQPYMSCLRLFGGDGAPSGGSAVEKASGGSHFEGRADDCLEQRADSEPMGQAPLAGAPTCSLPSRLFSNVVVFQMFKTSFEAHP